MTAGPALDRTHVAGYNCAYMVVDNLRAFDEAMYILMCGTGVGFSVEDKYVSQLPTVGESIVGEDAGRVFDRPSPLVLRVLPCFLRVS